MNLKEQLLKLREKLVNYLSNDSLEKTMRSSDKKCKVIEIALEEEDIKEMYEKINEIRDKKLSPMAEKISNHFRNIGNISLDSKVDDFILWYLKNMVKGSKIEKYSMAIDLRNFIEKMAVWYELRYPDYEINRILKCTADEDTNINEEMFVNNQYLEDVNEEIDYFNWSEFYNTKVFIDTLPQEEKRYLRKPAYPSLIYIDKTYLAHLHLSANGIVKLSEGMGLYTQYEITDEEIEEMHIEDVLTLFKEKNIQLPSYNEIIPVITSYQKKHTSMKIY